MLALEAPVVTGDLPSDVADVLAQLFTEAQRAFSDGRVQVGVSTLDTASTVVEHKVPEGTRRDRLLHGCKRAEMLAITEGETAVATEYVAAMARTLDETSPL